MIKIYFFIRQRYYFYSDIHGRAIVRDRLQILRRIIEEGYHCHDHRHGMDRLLPLEHVKDRIITVD